MYVRSNHNKLTLDVFCGPLTRFMIQNERERDIFIRLWIHRRVFVESVPGIETHFFTIRLKKHL